MKRADWHEEYRQLMKGYREDSHFIGISKMLDKFVEMARFYDNANPFEYAQDAGMKAEQVLAEYERGEL